MNVFLGDHKISFFFVEGGLPDIPIFGGWGVKQ